LKSAIIHDWLISGVGGGEKILEAIHNLYPSPIHTLVKNLKNLEGTYFEDLSINTSFIQKLFKASKYYKNYLPLFPLAIELFDLSEYDLVISSSHCVAKGVITTPDQLHICYCHTPVRYAWDLMYEYLREYRGLKKFFIQAVLHYLRNWDVSSATRVDYFIANSKYIAKRIEKCYRRKAEVIYPFVDLLFFEESDRKEDYYITASRFVPYKRIDLIVEAFTFMKKKLVVIGDGPEWKKVAAKAGSTIELLGYQSDQVLKSYLRGAKAFIFAAVEDFGIAPVEAMACGTPVIAFGKGGACETILDGLTGLFFHEQTVDAIVSAVKRFERMEFDSNLCRKRAEFFSRDKFNREFQSFVQEKCEMSGKKILRELLKAEDLISR